MKECLNSAVGKAVANHAKVGVSMQHGCRKELILKCSLPCLMLLHGGELPRVKCNLSSLRLSLSLFSFSLHFTK